MFKLPMAALLLLTVAPRSAVAQDFALDRGSVVLAGTISVTSYDYDDDNSGRTTHMVLNPYAMFFVSKGVAIGGEVYYEHTSSSGSTNWGVGPQVGYFFGKPDSSVYPFLGAAFEYVNLGSTAIDETAKGFNVGAGAVFTLSQHVGLVATVSYSVLNYEDDYDSWSRNDLGLDVGVAAFLF